MTELENRVRWSDIGLALIMARDYLLWLVEARGIKLGVVEKVREQVDKALAGQTQAIREAEKSAVQRHLDAVDVEKVALAIDDARFPARTKPTITELEAILAAEPGNVEIRPDGSVMVDGKPNSADIARAAIKAIRDD